jgi:uncharacterized protein (TIGR00251 family)
LQPGASQKGTAYLSSHKEGVTISLYVQPNAPKSEIIGEYNGTLKIKIKAPPIEGRANDAIIEFFSDILKIPKSRFEILRGDQSRHKVLLVRDASIEQMKTSLNLT